MHNWINVANLSFADEDDMICTICGIKAFKSYGNRENIMYYLRFKGYTQEDYKKMSCDDFIIKNIIE